MHAEWTKLRTVRAWTTALAAVPVMLVLFALLAGASSDQRGEPAIPLGPGGEPVSDSFYFVHQQLAGDGGLTVSVSSLTTYAGAKLTPEPVPWAKAGLIIKQGTDSGSPYAAIMVTGGHGVRMQSDYVHDTPGLPGPVSATSVRWLRLERAGDVITGYDSADGENWTEVGSAHVVGLGTAVQAGLFVASPAAVQGLGSVASVATADFANLDLHGVWRSGSSSGGSSSGGVSSGGSRSGWSGEQVGRGSRSFSGYPRARAGSFVPSGDGFTVTGAGDIALAVRDSLGGAGVVADILFGAFPALVVVIVIGTRFVTDAYRDALIHVTLAAQPHRGVVLAAKAVVLGVTTFATALLGTLIAVPIGERLARSKGVYLFPATLTTQLRVEIGTAALLATAAVLGLALGTVFRRSSAAVSTAAVVIVLPYLLVAQIPFVPAGVAGWLTKVTPAAAFAVQQTLVRHSQVASIYTPYNGYYPLAPWAGYAVLAGYAAAILALAAVLLRRRDA